MLSRVADSIYWMCRYIERAENVARFIDVNLILYLESGKDMHQQWSPLVFTTGDNASFEDRYDEPSMENVISFLTLDDENPNSIMSCLRAARENARCIREAISSEMWEHVNRYFLLLKEMRSLSDILADPHPFFDQVRRCGQQFMGITDATMTHGEGWHFGRVGRYLERADKTARILDVKYFMLLPSPSDVGTPLDEVQWAALLQSASAFEMYRQSHGSLSPAHIVEFLVLDKLFPRAVLHCLTQANASLHAISGTPTGSFSNDAERLLGRLRAELAYTRASNVITSGLHEFIDHLETRLNEIGEGIYNVFFAQNTEILPPNPLAMMSE
jgi:uncharacterized alpha-E superfamily protein